MEFFVCLLVGAAVAGAIMLLIRRKLKTVRAEKTACSYTRSGSFKVTGQSDRYLFNHVSRIPKSDTRKR
ncbi:MAG: hypothetical protein FWG87_07160 [Defluviitaleaceae bacterium]|nr:hypothetical protein [Defluviitaleaceae bacterium]